MTYNPAIPQPGDQISSSQSQILTNFAQADVAFAIDHVAFSTLANQGKHKKVDLLQIPAPGSAAAQSVLYCKSASGNSEIFMQRDGVAAELQLTSGTPVFGSTGSTFLPGLSGQVIGARWGQFTFTGTTTNISYVTAFVGSTFGVVLTPINAGAAAASYRVSTTTNADFTIVTGVSVVNASYFYIALGN